MPPPRDLPPRDPDPADLDEVRRSYDRVADNYVAMGLGDVRTHPWLRAAIDAFAAGVRGRGPVLDVGCGPGHVTAYLAELGLDVSGVDLSPRMVEHARRRYPDLRFAVASATALGLDPASHGGILGWWSLFNLPRSALGPVLAHCAQALVPGGHLIIATHGGTGEFARREGYGGVPVTWTTHLWTAEQLLEQVVAAGLEPVADLRLPGQSMHGAALVLDARRPE